MTANLTTNKSLFSNRVPAWHNLGFVAQTDMTAKEALSNIDSFEYAKIPLNVEIEGESIETGAWAIVNKTLKKFISTVSGFYEILQPVEIAESFDNGIQKPVETLGFLGKAGERVFLSWKLPAFDVNGDMVENFALVSVGYDGKTGASIHLTSVRVVCQNTFTQAVGESERNNGKIWTGRHNSKTLKQDLTEWFNHLPNLIARKTEENKYTFESLDTYKIDDTATLANVLFNIYPDPKPVPDYYPPQIKARKEAERELVAEKAKRDRLAVENLFNGQGTAINATAWGLFNAVTEYENYVRVEKKRAQESILWGNRANTMIKALETLKIIARKKQ
jgi:hypothetical protein